VVVVELGVGAGEELFRFALVGVEFLIEVFAGDEGFLRMTAWWNTSVAVGSRRVPYFSVGE
jgi:hypothetical protein